MAGYQIEVESVGIKSRWMCNYPSISKALDEVFKTCKDYQIQSIKLLKSKGRKDG